MMVEADDVVLTDIRSNDAGDGVEFNMHVRSGDSMVLDGQDLLQAVEVQQFSYRDVVLISSNLMNDELASMRSTDS